jgi:hypothetical protein
MSEQKLNGAQIGARRRAFKEMFKAITYLT